MTKEQRLTEKEWASTQIIPQKSHNQSCQSWYQIRYLSASWNLHAQHPSHLTMEEVRRYQWSHTVVTAKQPSKACTKPSGQRSWGGPCNCTHLIMLLSCLSLLRSEPWGRNLFWCICIWGRMYLLCVLCCVCLDVELWCLSPFHPLQPAEFWEQQSLKTRLVFSAWGLSQWQGEADRDGVDGLGMLQGLGGSCSITALWEGRQWEEVQSGSRQCLHGGNKGSWATLFPSNQLLYNYN